MYIGDIYLPILSSIDKKSVSKITKEIAGINITEPKSVSIRRNLQPVTLDGYLYNDGEKNDEQYAEDVEALQYRSAGYCYTKYADLDGFIEIDNADAPQTSEELGVRNYSIEGKYLPATKYERVVEVETEMRENEFNIEFPPHVALPIGATNVRVKTSQDSVKLSAPAFMAGDIPIYRPFPAFYPADVTHSDSDAPQYDATAYKLTYNLLDAENENISYTMVSGVDIPLGSYRVVLRIKEDSVVTGDVKITVSDGTTNVVDSLHTLVGDGVWNIVKTASFSILQKGLTYTVTVSKATDSVSNIAVNYGFLLPEKRARVAFDVAAEYDVGECKVYDTVTTDAAEAGWIQVYNPEHDFAGDIVVQNSMFRWVIKQTAWKDATKVYNVTGTSPVEIGELYNKAFGDDSVAIKFKEIKPNYLKFTFELDTGNATSESTSAKEIDTVEITPFNVVIDKDVIGTYKDHYTFESTPGINVESENGIIAGIDANSVYGLIKFVDVTSSYDGDIIETTGSESSDSYVVPFVIPCEITSYLYKQATDLVISKDNNDIERKFWKDDFSVDSSENYINLVESSSIYDTDHLVLSDGKSIQLKHGDITPNKFRIKVKQTGLPSSMTNGTNQFHVRLTGTPRFTTSYIDGDLILLCYNGGSNTNQLVVNIYQGSIYADFNHTFATTADYLNFLQSTWTIEYEFLPNGKLKVTIPELSKTVTSTWIPSLDDAVRPYIVAQANLKAPLEIYEIISLPSISYADDFATDTVTGANGRYQAVTGTVAYDDVNKRMNVTTATGVNGKASGRLKSYTFTEGSQIYDVTLPTGADGDFITLVTHSANGLMTDGIGVGLQSDGAGNWNLATLSGTTVTEGADSGLVDGKTARIEIEKDLYGAYWYYIYDAAGTKPTTATGKLFTTLTEGYTGWYANGAGATTQTYAIDNISIRAESIVGRTNVEVEEPFWLRDEFSENDAGRWLGNTSSFTWDTGNSRLALTTQATTIMYPQKLDDINVSFTVDATGNLATDGIQITLVNTNKSHTSWAITGNDDKYVLWMKFNDNILRLYKYHNETSLTTDLTGYSQAVTYQAVNTVSVVRSGNTFTVTLNGTPYTITDLNTSGTTIEAGYFGINGYISTATFYLSELQISGTRVYNKPIHRGAMLESYNNGSEVIVATSLNYDFNWNCIAEFTGVTSSVVDTTNGRLTLADTTYIFPTGLTFGEGYYQFKIQRSAASGSITLLVGNNEINITNAGVVAFNGGTAESYTIDPTNAVNVELLVGTTSITVYADRVLKGTKTGLTIAASNVKMKMATANFYVYDIIINAESSDTTSGVVACVGGIGSGARYGVQEEVYNTFTTTNVDKGSYLAAAKTKTTNPNADEASLKFINETDSTTLSLERTETEKSLTLDANYAVINESLYIDDEATDTLTVGVKNSTTCNQPATYVESLSLIPVSGNSVLYPQDLAFISGVKPSQKRKVEVK